jgi:hypothetical protein
VLQETVRVLLPVLYVSFLYAVWFFVKYLSPFRSFVFTLVLFFNLKFSLHPVFFSSLPSVVTRRPYTFWCMTQCIWHLQSQWWNYRNRGLFIKSGRMWSPCFFLLGVPFQLLNQQTVFHENWYEHYAFGGRLNLTFFIVLQLVLTNMAGARTYELRATLDVDIWSDKW